MKDNGITTEELLDVLSRTEFTVSLSAPKIFAVAYVAGLASYFTIGGIAYYNKRKQEAE